MFGFRSPCTWSATLNPGGQILKDPVSGFFKNVNLILQAHYKAHKKELLATVEDVIQGKAAIGGTGPSPMGEAAPSEGIRLVLRQLLPNFQSALERS